MKILELTTPKSLRFVLRVNLKNLNLKEKFIYKVKNFNNTSNITQFLISKKKNL